ncbi:MAG: MBL fold metallo-hydrolase [Flavobacteriales bacterium]|nr:MBL fold metallo-hydrolase [Flavobacteriales bacterium]
MRIAFYGAAQQVTGSMYLLTLTDGYNILIDCGLNYEKDVAREENAKFPFDPQDIDLVVLTHAHIDHSGNLPTLFARGYEGKILCTEPTWRLSDILLMDSANIEAKRTSGKKNKKTGAKRLFGHKQVMDVVQSMVTLKFNKPFSIRENMRVELVPAGHILGASSIVFSIVEKGEEIRVGFTGDLGKNDAKIIMKPQPMINLNYLIMEGTYGSRLHRDPRSPEDCLIHYIKKTCIEQPGRLIIPAFSVGRTQAILFTLNRIFREAKLPAIQVFTDSPLGISSGNIHEDFAEYFNEEAKDFAQKYGDLFRFKDLLIVEDKEDEEIMNRHYKPSIIVSSSGMLDGGRIQKHIADNLQNPMCTILIAGYCTEGTLGAELLAGKKTVKANNKIRDVYAKIESTDVFSAHPDQIGLTQYFQNVLSGSQNLKKVFLAHGDKDSLATFKTVLQPHFTQIEIPARGEEHTFV